MSVRITVSYSEEQELQNIINLLGSNMHHIKRRKSTYGIFKKADIRLKE